MAGTPRPSPAPAARPALGRFRLSALRLAAGTLKLSFHLLNRLQLLLDLVPKEVASQLLTDAAVRRANAIADAAEVAKFGDTKD